METLIEFYVKEQFNDLIAAVAFKPKTTVFLSGGFMPDKATRAGMTRFIEAHGAEGAKVRFIDIGSRSIASLLKKLEEIAAEYPGCVINMTGGPAAALVAAHRFSAKKRIRSFFFDPSRARFVNIYGMQREIASAKLPKLSVKDIIAIGGGLVTGTGHSVAGLDGDLDCAKKVLGIYGANLSKWNAFAEYLQFGTRHYYDPKTQLFTAPSAVLNNSSLLWCNKKLAGLLEEAGAIKELQLDGENVSFRFKNGFFKELLTTVGMCLELFVYISARESGAFDSVDMSVVFDWDGVIHGNFNDTVNEIDVIMTAGLSSAFVTCKSARPDTRDLYEISYLASRFGGSGAKVVLATATDLSGESWAIYMRAHDMGVIVIEKRDIEAGFSAVAKKLVSPTWLDERPQN